MKWLNRQFGELDVEEKHVLHFPDGIIGFEECKRFLIVHDEDSEPFRWLVSLEDSDLSFPLLDPTLIAGDYARYVQTNADTNVFVVATLCENIEQSTVNLRSPIFIDGGRRIGKQIVLEQETLQLQHPLVPASHEPARG